MRADAWAAWAQWATAAIAFGAAIFAYLQVKLARETRERVAQPDVVVFIDHNPTHWHYMDLVVRNFGQTPAYNVKVILPPLKVVPYTNESTEVQVTDLYFPSTLAVLAPGQEWRTVWDSGIEREEYEGELQSQFIGRVEFDDKMNADKPSHVNPISLDTDMFRDTIRVETVKDKSAEKALYEISSTLKSFNKEHDGIWMYTVAGDDERKYHQQRTEAMRARPEKSNSFLQRLRQSKDAEKNEVTDD
jgi:hypothetical protein